MNIKRSLVVAAAIAAIGAGSLFAITSASAQGEDGNSLIDRITERFGLNRDEVQAVFDEVRAEKEAQHKQKMEERLNKAVEEGKLTEEQKNAILTKMEEEKAFRESLKDMSEKERKAALEQHKEDMKTWAEENGIEKPFLFFGKKHGPKGQGGKQGPNGPRGDRGPGAPGGFEGQGSGK